MGGSAAPKSASGGRSVRVAEEGASSLWRSVGGRVRRDGTRVTETSTSGSAIFEAGSPSGTASREGDGEGEEPGSEEAAPILGPITKKPNAASATGKTSHLRRYLPIAPRESTTRAL